MNVSVNSQSDGKFLTTSVLTVSVLAPEDEGDLVCTMNIGDKRVTSKSCDLVVVGIEQPPLDVTAMIGLTAKLYCIATGS